MGNNPWMGKSVVIIDDSRRVREELRAAFTACGMQVVAEAENGVSGFDLVHQLKPEVASLDLIMPEMDGVECYRKMHAASPETKIIMISWLGGEPKILDNLKDLIPGYCFQTKPVSAAELATCLERVYFPHSIKVAGKSVVETTEDFLDLGVKVS